ncbi:carbohydrate kinase family protein [Allorhodopirellula solitaria]|uniref:Putative sugar kinase YdjH n=1 Tax=Allorhodopirellula solitaria TaxID=2527987 RepID=A0A5C5WP34_9BACT|nr:carbohydrate kinase family protein [Allorhodopirellula solitaria]TWT51899.1 putative sugar kinase YdjH [Allorhodopirellula solitaria]
MLAKSLDEKLARIHHDPSCEEFILADAKDADMAFGIAAPGVSHETGQRRTLQQYRELIRQNTEQGLIDIMLMSVSTNEVLTINERLFDRSRVTPAIRANDTTEIWLARGGVYSAQPSRPFRTALLDHGQTGRADSLPAERQHGADLGLYSVTFNNDTEHDARTLAAYREFCLEAEQKGFRHFLEVFDPNCPVNPIEDVGSFVNDHIVRALAGVAQRGRPLFLKMVYHGPAAMEELVNYDSSIVVGILGGSSGTTFDAFHQLWEAKKYGARVALYGRMINNSEHQPTFIKHLRYLADGQLSDAAEAVRSYHNELRGLGIAPLRRLEDDLQATNRFFDYSSGLTTKTSAKTSVRGLPSSEAAEVGPEIVVAGHICLDIVPEFPDHFSVASANTLIEAGKLKQIGPATQVTGGCVANTGLTLHQLGVRTSLMGKIGDDSFGRELLSILHETDSELAQGMIVAPGEHTSYSIVIMPPGVDRSFLHFPAANDTFHAADIPLDRLADAKIFHFGYPPLMQRFWEDGGIEMGTLLRNVKSRGLMTSLDMAMPDPDASAGQIDWNVWLERVLPHVDCFMPSLDEILFMLGSDPVTEPMPAGSDGQFPTLDRDALSQTADRLLALGTGMVVFKLGDQGLYLKTSSDADRISRGFYQDKSGVEEWVGRELHAPCFEVKVGSTNGAGDRTIAGFLAALARNAGPEEALEKAVAVGGMSVESSGSESHELSFQSIDQRIHAGWQRQAGLPGFAGR